MLAKLFYLLFKSTINNEPVLNKRLFDDRVLIKEKEEFELVKPNCTHRYGQHPIYFTILVPLLVRSKII